jgi:cell division protein FtsB
MSFFKKLSIQVKLVLGFLSFLFGLIVFYVIRGKVRAKDQLKYDLAKTQSEIETAKLQQESEDKKQQLVDLKKKQALIEKKIEYISQQ